MITVGEIEEIMEDKNITFMPPKDDIIRWTRENFGKANLTAVVVIDKFIAFVQEWNNKDLSTPNTSESLDKPVDSSYICKHGDYIPKLDSDGDVYYECGRCGAYCYEIGA